MKALIYTFLALFISASIPVDAIASRGDRHERRSATYSENTDHNRYEKRHHNKKHYRKHHRKTRHIRPQHWRPTQRVQYVPAPVYRSYIAPSGYFFTTAPGVTFYFSW